MISEKNNIFFKALSEKLNIKNPKLNGFLEGKSINMHDALKIFSEKNELSMRLIKLDLNWWKFEQSVLVGFNENGSPVILTPRFFGGYLMIDLLNHYTLKIDQKTVGKMQSLAYMFYPDLPKTRISIKMLLMRSFNLNRQDYAKVFLTHVIIGLLALVSPIIGGYFFTYIIPYADKSALLQISLVLISSVIISSIVKLNYQIAVTRIKLISDLFIQSAIWKRLTFLPIGFFMLMNSGDLSNRASAVESIQQGFSSVTIGALLTGIFSIFSFTYMLYLNIRLSLFLLLIVLLVSFFVLIAAIRQNIHYKEMYKIEGEQYGRLNQVFQSIAKIKVFNAQGSFYQRWLSLFLEECDARVKSEKIAINMSIVNNFSLMLGSVAIFYFAFKLKVFTSFGEFFVYNAMYTNFASSFAGLTDAFAHTYNLIPLMKRAKPILNTKPEDVLNGVKLKAIKGRLEVSNAFFRYENPAKYQLDDDNSYLDVFESEKFISPWVLKNVNMQVEENDYVAIIGASGSGKTTLIKLLLGLMVPQKGALSIDNYDYQIIDKFHYRKELGVILQSSTLFSGTIRDNIMPDGLVESEFVKSIEDLDALAKTLGIDDFIQSLPMKYDTLLSEGGRNISMGQKQKILLLKTFMRKPKLLILDEATSALDNASQIKIFDYLSTLKATRIVVSHRLTTIKQAKKIFVLEEGNLILIGDYKALMDSRFLKDCV